MDYVLLEILEVFKVYTWWNKIPLRKQRWHFNIKAVLNEKTPYFHKFPLEHSSLDYSVSFMSISKQSMGAIATMGKQLIAWFLTNTYIHHQN